MSKQLYIAFPRLLTTSTSSFVRHLHLFVSLFSCFSHPWPFSLSAHLIHWGIQNTTNVRKASCMCAYPSLSQKHTFLVTQFIDLEKKVDSSGYFTYTINQPHKLMFYGARYQDMAVTSTYMNIESRVFVCLLRKSKHLKKDAPHYCHSKIQNIAVVSYQTFSKSPDAQNYTQVFFLLPRAR